MSYLHDLKTAAEVHDDVAAAAKARRLALNITQEELCARSGVAIATLRRFEGGGPASLATVLAVAETLGALGEFAELFPKPEARTLDDITARELRKRASRVKQS